jgi:hypothetical protein
LSTPLDFLHHVDRVFTVDFGQFDFHNLVVFCRDFLADEVGFDGKLTVAPVDQNSS